MKKKAMSGYVVNKIDKGEIQLISALKKLTTAKNIPYAYISISGKDLEEANLNVGDLVIVTIKKFKGGETK